MCIYCRDTDEIHHHHPGAPAVNADGPGYRIVVAGLPLELWAANLTSEVKAQSVRITTLEDEVARLKAEAERSNTP